MFQNLFLSTGQYKHQLGSSPWLCLSLKLPCLTPQILSPLIWEQQLCKICPDIVFEALSATHPIAAGCNKLADRRRMATLTPSTPKLESFCCENVSIMVFLTCCSSLCVVPSSILKELFVVQFMYPTSTSYYPKFINICNVTNRIPLPLRNCCCLVHCCLRLMAGRKNNMIVVGMCRWCTLQL